MASKKKPKSKSKPKKSNHKPVKKIARQESLPGLEDRAIKAIDNAAMDYAEVRDQRQALTADESSLKAELLELLKKHKKTHYKHGKVEVTLVTEKENVKVRVKDENEEKPDDTQPEPEEETFVSEPEDDEFDEDAADTDASAIDEAEAS